MSKKIKIVSVVVVVLVAGIVLGNKLQNLLKNGSLIEVTGTKEDGLTLDCRNA